MCYVLPPLLFDTMSTAPVITPLKAIMFEQKHFLAAKGIKVAVLTNKEEMEENDVKAVTSGDVQIIFASPEAALGPWYKALKP